MPNLEIRDTNPSGIELTLGESTGNFDFKVPNVTTVFENEKERIAAEDERKLAEENRKRAEAERQINEENRNRAETERNNSEDVRNSNEEIRNTNELSRQKNEENRIKQETAREENENNRSSSETAREKAETERNKQENQRQQNELAREKAEDNRNNAEKAREDYIKQLQEQVKNGEVGNGIKSIELTNGNHEQGTLDTYTITFTDKSTKEIQIYNGQDGKGTGDMLKETYDTDNDGVVDNAQKVNGYTVESNVPKDAKFSDTVYDDSKIKEDIEDLQKNAVTLSENQNITGVKNFSASPSVPEPVNNNDAVNLKYLKDQLDSLSRLMKKTPAIQKITADGTAGATITTPKYKVGANVLDVYWNGLKLIKGTDENTGHYLEVGNTNTISSSIKLTSDWYLRNGDVLEFIVRGEYE